MSEEFAHLIEAVKPEAALREEDRIVAIQRDRWVGYTRAETILATLEALLRHPKVSRMPNLLIVGDSNNGKSMLVQRFKERHPAVDNEKGDGIVLPVLVVQTPTTADEGRLYSSILEECFAPFRHSDPPDKKYSQITELFKVIALRVLVLDDIHNILAGPEKKRRQFLNVLRYCGNGWKVPIVACGIDTAFNAVRGDEQLSNRFRHAVLPRWSHDIDYLRLLASFERLLPLRQASVLTGQDIAKSILALAEGVLGEIVGVLKAAAIEAVRRGTEKITLDIVTRMEWARLSERKRGLEGSLV